MSTPHRTPRTGTTLLELMLVLAVMGVATSVVAFAASRTRGASSPEVRRALRHTAILQGHDTTVQVIERGRRLLITARPTGQLLEDTVGAAATSTPAIHAR